MMIAQKRLRGNNSVSFSVGLCQTHLELRRKIERNVDESSVLAQVAPRESHGIKRMALGHVALECSAFLVLARLDLNGNDL